MEIYFYSKIPLKKQKNSKKVKYLKTVITNLVYGRICTFFFQCVHFSPDIMFLENVFHHFLSRESEANFGSEW